MEDIVIILPPLRSVKRRVETQRTCVFSAGAVRGAVQPAMGILGRCRRF